MNHLFYMWLWFNATVLGTPSYWIPYSVGYHTIEECTKDMNEYTSIFKDKKVQCSIKAPKDTTNNKGKTLWIYAPPINNARSYWVAIASFKDMDQCTQALAGMMPIMKTKLECNNNQPEE